MSDTVTRAECDRRHADLCDKLKDLSDGIEIHDDQAKHISDDVQVIKGEVREVKETQKLIAESQYRTQVQIEQQAKDRAWYQKLIYRMITLGAALLMVLVGAKLSGVPL